MGPENRSLPREIRVLDIVESEGFLAAIGAAHAETAAR
jgi:hypothetical protein